MTTDFWFGWLVKGHCEVTGLDKVIGFVEFAVVIALAAIAWSFFVSRKKK